MFLIICACPLTGRLLQLLCFLFKDLNLSDDTDSNSLKNLNLSDDTDSNSLKVRDSRLSSIFILLHFVNRTYSTLP
jgi:hypothetical protein